MRRLVLPLVALLISMSVGSALRADPREGGLITPSQANRHGLKRAWFTQIRMTPGGTGIVDLRLHISSISAQSLFRVVSDQGPVYTFSDRNLDIFGEPLGQEGAGKAAAEKVRLLRHEGIESRIEQAVVPDVTIYATTGSGLVYAIDAETGQQRWLTVVGKTRYPTTPPAVTDRHVAVVNGQTLYILQADTGVIIAERRVVGGPGAGPTIVGNTAYVPMLNGHLKAYSFGPDTFPWPLTYRSQGSVHIQPTAAGDRVAWANDAGDISILANGKHGIRYRLRLTEKVAGPIIYVPPQQILGVTVSGNLYSFDVMTGQMMWRYASGDASIEPAAIVGDNVFLMTRDHGLHAVSVTAGRRVWPSSFEQARKFVAATADRVYCTTDMGQMVALDAKTGRQVSQIPLSLNDRVFANNQTDRIYIATPDGALQCLHELGAVLPTLHLVEPVEPPAAADAEAGEEGAADPDASDVAAPEEDPDPFRGS